MSFLTDIADALGLLSVSADARNLLLWPAPPPVPLVGPPLVEGVLTHVTGDLTTDNAARPRVSAILGPGATVAGVAVQLATIIATITTRTTAAPIPNAAQVARALLAYSATHLTDDYASRLQVGFRMPLPIELDTAAGTWVTNLESLRAWRQLAPDKLDAALHRVVTPLPLDDPDNLRMDVAFALGPVADLTTLATPLAIRLMTNPYEAVFWTHEVFYRIRTDRSAEEPGFAIALLSPLVQHQVDLLATTTAGAAVLRRVWSALTGPAAAALPAAHQAGLLRSKRLVATAVGLAAGAAADTWRGPLEVGPTTPPRELVLPASASPRPTVNRLELAAVAPAETADGMQAMVLGRQLCAGSWNRWPDNQSGITYRGPSYGGRIDVAAFVSMHRSEIGATPLNASLEARVDVVVAIAPNEGWVDGVRLRDKGMLSTGMQQWTVPANDEATVLFEHFRGLSAEDYDLFFGLYGLQPRIWVANDVPVMANPTDAAVIAANPEADRGVIAAPASLPADPRTHFPRLVTLFQVTPGQQPKRMPAGLGNPRFGYFGGTMVSPTDHRFSALWAGRARLAGLYSVAYQIAQIQMAANRFTRLARNVGTVSVPNPPGVAVKYPVGDLFTSTYGAALLLDAHINQPKPLPADVDWSVKHTAGPTHVGGVLSPAWLAALATTYQVRRRLGTAKIKIDRDAFINGLLAAGRVSDAPGTFTGW